MSDGSREANAIDRLRKELTGGSETDPDRKVYVTKKKEPHKRQENKETERHTMASSRHFYILQDNHDGTCGKYSKVAVIKASDVTAEKLAKWRNSNTKNVTRISAGALFQELMDLGQFEKPEDWEEVEDDES